MKLVLNPALWQTDAVQVGDKTYMHGETFEGNKDLVEQTTTHFGEVVPLFVDAKDAVRGTTEGAVTDGT